ncbi:RNA polymerase sigma factor SigJ [Fodinibius sp. Rm-B-1B1-1]|uniref:RNA polymerase sigma factor SigJ n=1 Tax=Fodinibius alkaliphilus TaxID=3140241 RepID=UPI00315A1460
MDADNKTTIFNRHRAELINIAYGMLGNLPDARDIVQDAYIKWNESDTEVHNHESYLKTIVSRLCIDRYRSAKSQREEYMGPWLPQPVVDSDSNLPDSNIELHEKLTVALLYLLENLSPDQRAIYLLHDVFGYKFSEISELVDKKPATCRKAAQRARQNIQHSTISNITPNPESQQIVDEFIEALYLRDMDKLQAILTDNAVLYSDGGGEVTAAPKPIDSMKKVSKFLISIAEKNEADIDLEMTSVNNCPGFKVYQRETLHSIWTFHIHRSRISAIFVILNPSKLEAYE